MVAISVPVAGVRSTESEYTGEDMEFNWSTVLTLYQLLLLRNFFCEGIDVSIMEEKVWMACISKCNIVFFD